MSEVQVGDYVFATKYADGDPGDQHCVGFIAADVGMWRPRDARWTVVDRHGVPFRGNGFRAVRKIAPQTGSDMLSLMPSFAGLHMPGHSLWFVLDDLERIPSL